MYMIGLLPFGLTKLFSLWLYAKQQQMKAAKITTFSLTADIIFSVTFVSYLGVVGLALGTTISGIVSFILTLRVFGAKPFLNIFLTKHALYLLGGSVVLTILLLLLKEFIHVHF